MHQKVYGRGMVEAKHILSGRRIRQIARYLKNGQYRPRFPFYETGRQVMFAQEGGAFFRQFEKEMTKILAKAGYR